MKNLLTIIILTVAISAQSQINETKEKQAVLEKVNQFFSALEKKDTALFKSISFTNTQVWSSRSMADSIKTSMRYVSDDILRLSVMKETIEEKPLKYDISLHGNIAIVWAPYTLSLSGKFSHCGIDVFTLLKTNEGWKIISIAYTVEPDGCAEIKKENNLQ